MMHLTVYILHWITLMQASTVFPHGPQDFAICPSLCCLPLLQPNAQLKELQDTNNLTKLMTVQEEMKTFPFGDVWDYFCESCGVPVGFDWFTEVEKYEKEVLSSRN